ncbi:D-arabinono-1,4-lactone oxidase [uncultured Alcanivorax sp.]|uniref:D-arabinono-1,4-lactone oxidase n=1 Tax=uncultured Alcanivorax sp. TaxID=191215 RepID=UPI00260AAC8B|nr:D-arabinono-1,4-lactone oxidase [uncultured Alcanivorax sp.]
MALLDSIDRRSFLKALASAGATGALAPQALLAETGTAPAWQNWSGNQSANPANLVFATSESQLRQTLRDSSGTIRPFGGSHSFSAVVPSDDTLVSLEALAGLRGQDSDIFTYGGGTRLAMASAQANNLGYSFSNEPDINLQSLAGAIATSTHGTGSNLQSLSGQVESLRLILPDGEALSLTREDGDTFLAACCSIGALGVVSEIGFRLEPAYRLKERTWTLPLQEAMDFVEREKDNFRHIEFFAFPLGEQAIVKTMEITDDPTDSSEREDSNDLLELVCKVAMRAGWLTPNLQKLVTLFVEDSTYTGPAHKVFANRRTVRFNEMEYTVPAEDGIACLQEVCETIRKQDINVFFPIEFRYVAADDRLLSMYHDRPGASLSIHQYFAQDYQPLFTAVEPILRRYAGRPHCGKLHTLGQRQLRELYPAFDRFQAVRRELDPQGRMLNQHLQTLFGATG